MSEELYTYYKCSSDIHSGDGTP